MVNSNVILKQRQFVSTAKQTPFWACINLSFLLLILLEFKLSVLSSISSIYLIKNLITFIEIFLIILFFINFLYNIYIFIWFKKFLQSIQLSSDEYRLYGIDDDELGFKLKSNDNNNDNDDAEISKSKFSILNLNENFSNYQRHSSPAAATKMTTTLTPTSLSLPPSVPPPSPSSSLDSLSLFNNDSSFNKKYGLRNRRTFLTNNNGGNGGDKNFSLKINQQQSIQSIKDLERYLQEHEQRQCELEELLYQEQKNFYENSSTMYSTSMNSSINSSFGHQNNHSFTSQTSKHVSFLNNSNNQQRFNSFNDSWQQQQSPTNQRSMTPPPPLYKPAIKLSSTPNLLLSSEKSESLNTSTRIIEKILMKLMVDDQRLNQMVENIRKWISQTILIRICREIESINKLIIDKGYIDTMIGETSLKQLKQLSENRRQEFPTLEKVLPFLDINDNNDNIDSNDNQIQLQEYLVKRLKDLAKGGCMIEFIWDGGGSYNYRQWKPEQFITDSELILHLFCTYMDSRLLFNPALPEGKPFTSQHFRSATKMSSKTTTSIPIPTTISTPVTTTTTISTSTTTSSTISTTPTTTNTSFSSSPTTKSKTMIKSDIYIRQDKIYPPHYSLILKGEHFEIPPGRNNLFYAILLFIHHIKVKNFGLLGRINLGPSGLNIAWVIE